jgi:LemA protein
MSTDTLIHLALAVLLVCWAVGAHNRLVRLKNAVGEAYARIDAELAGRQALIDQLMPSLLPGDAELWAGFEQAVRAQRVALEQLRQQPSGGDQTLALQRADEVLDAQLASLWQWPHTQQAVRIDPLLRQILWELSQIDGRLEVVAEPYNQAVARFNEAVLEFPAWLVARLASLKPLPGLHLGRHGAAREAARPLMAGRRASDPVDAADGPL